MGSGAVAWNTDDVVVGHRLLRCRGTAAPADWKTVDAVLGEAARTRAGAGAAKIDDTFVGEAAKERTIAARSTQSPAMFVDSSWKRSNFGTWLATNSVLESERLTAYR